MTARKSEGEQDRLMDVALRRDQERWHGVSAALASAACFVVNDGLVKLTAQSMPISQLIFVRGAFALTLILTVATLSGIPISMGAFLNGRILLRASLDTFAAFAFVLGLSHLPLANATAIFMATPLMISLMVLIGSDERVDFRRWSAILTGFIGVLLVVQPATAKFNAWSLLILLSACFAAARDFVTKSVRRDYSSLVVTLIAVLIVMLSAGAGAFFEQWKSLSGEQFAILGLAGGAMSGGYFFVTVAMRADRISIVAPLRYSALIFAAALGYIVWGDVPNLLAWFGMTMTILAGIYMLRSH